MDRLEQSLRATLTDPRRGLPGDLVPLERVHAGARRRRRRREALLVAGTALAVLAVTVPLVLAAGGARQTAPPPAQAPSPAVSDGPSPSQEPSGEPEVLAWGAATPISVTATTEDRFVVLGRLPQCVHAPCLRLAGTTDGGGTFAPLVPPPARDATGVRFGSASDGWAFGDGLWATHDGARSWTRVHLAGPVVRLEAAAGTAWALVARSGTSSLWRAPVATDDWTRVEVPGGLAGNADLALQGSRVVLLNTGAHAAVWTSDDGGRFTSHPSPCVPELGGRLSATSDGLWAVCPTGTAAGVWVSPDGGRSFRSVPVAPAGGGALPNSMLVGARDAQTAVLAVEADDGLVLVDASGRRLSSYATGTGWTYVGMTSPDVGYAITCCSVGELLRTTDGGDHWSAVKVS